MPPQDQNGQSQQNPKVSPLIPQYEQPRQSHKKLWTIIILAILILIIGVGSVFAYKKLSRPNPQTVFTNMFKAHSDVTSFGYAVDLKGTVQSGAKASLSVGNSEFTFTSNGKMDVKDEKNIITDATFGMNAKGSDENVNVDVDTKLHVITSNNRAYLNFENLKLDYSGKNSDPMSHMFIGLVKEFSSQITNKWLYADMQQTDVSNIVNPETPLLKEKLMKFDYVESVEQLADEQVNDKDTYHYKVTINHEKFQKILDDSQAAGEEMIGSGVVALSNPQFEVWIGKADSRLYKMKIIESKYKDEESDSTINLTGEFTVKDYNQPVQVIVPKDAIYLEDFMEDLFMTAFIGANQSTYFDTPAMIYENEEVEDPDQNTKGSLAHFRAQSEIHYNTYNSSYASLCVDGRINEALYGPAVMQLYKSKGAQGQTQAGIKCISSTEKYAMSLPLNSGKSWCIDSMGYANAGKVNVSTLSCTQE